MEWTINPSLILLVFFATILSYSLQRILRHTGGNEINSIRHQWVYKQINLLFVLIVISSCLSGYLFFKIFSFYELLYFSPLIVIALFYAVKLFRKSLRDIPFLKIILIASSWAAVTVLIPAYINQELSAYSTWAIFTLNFIYIFALVIPFDIRDLQVDEPEKKTIPQLIGWKASKYTGITLLIICGLLSYTFFKEAIYSIPIYFFSILLMLQVNDKRKELFYAFGIDGLILLFPFSTWIIKSYI